MSWELSEFGQGLCTGSGIGELMEDLGEALAAGGERMRMLGGGQPAHIPEVDAVWRLRMEEIMASRGELERMLGGASRSEHVERRSACTICMCCVTIVDRCIAIDRRSLISIAIKDRRSLVSIAIKDR